MDVSVSELIEKYKIGRTHFYQVRLAAMKKATGIDPFKKGGNKSYISSEGVKFLDSLDIWIQENGSDVDRFLFERYGIGEDPNTAKRSELFTNSSQNSEQSVALSVMAQLATALEGLRNSQNSEKDSRILGNFYELQDACDHGWLIPSSKLAILLGFHSIRSLRGDSIERYGFRCIRQSKTSITSGRESEWKIERLASG